MTCKQLIEELQKFPADMEVFCWDMGGLGENFDTVEEVKETHAKNRYTHEVKRVIELTNEYTGDWNG